MNINVQEKLNSFIASNSELKGKPEQVILSAMMTNGIISRAEYEQACQNSAFGTGFSNSRTMGLSIERSESCSETQDVEKTDKETIEYENGKIKSKKATDCSSETTYTYLRNDDGIEFAVIHTTLADGTEITTTALNVNPETGEINKTDFINRTTTKPDGTVTVVTNDFALNGLLREVIITQDKITTNIYNSTDIDKYGNKNNENLNRLAQNIEVNGHSYNIRYDGEGNTYVVLQNGDCIADLTKDFKTTKQQLDKLNKGNFNYDNMQVGGIIRVPNEVAADDKSVKNRKTSKEAQAEFFNWNVKHEQADLLTCTLSEHTIKKKHTSVESLAREILPNGTKEQIRTLALRLQMVNKDLVKRLNPGEKITVALEGDKTSIAVAKAAGFAPNQGNNAFYQVLNSLSKKDRQKAIAAIQECKNAKITDLTEIKKRVFTKTGISLFDSGKTIKAGNTIKPLEYAIKEHLGLNIEGVLGHIIYQRLSAIPQENLSQTDLKKVAAALGNKSPESLDQVIMAFEATGISIMTKDEIQNNAVNYMGCELVMPEIPRLRTQNYAAKIIETQYDQGITILQQYKDNSGMLAKIYEGFATGIDKTFDCKQAHSATEYIEHLKKEKEQILKMLDNTKLSSGNNHGYRNAFYQTTGIEFNEKNIQDFIELVNNKVDPNTPQYQNAFKKAFGSRLVDNTSKFVESKAFWAGCGNLTLSIYAMMNPLSRGLTSRFAGAIGGGLRGNIIANAVLMGSSTAAIEGLDLAVKDTPISKLDVSNYIQSVAVSTGFGAFAGYMAPKFQKVCATVSNRAATTLPKLFKAPDAKKLAVITKPIEAGKTVSGAELMANYLTAPGSNIAGKAAEFVTEILAFTGYSVPAGMIAKFTALAFDKDGTLKAQYSNEESFLGLIKQELGHQLEGLTSCKGLTKILMAFCSKKNTQAGIMQEQLKSFNSLKNIEFQHTEVNGQKVLVAKTPNGNFKINSPAEAVTLCQTLMSAESAILMDSRLQEQNGATITTDKQPKETAVREEVSSLRERYTNQTDRLNQMLKDAGLDQIGKMTSRVKGEQSLYDKITNYLEDNPNAPLEDAVKSVRDAFGARTVVQSQDFTTHPEVKALIEAGDIKGAQLRAAELQSAPALEKLKGMILSQAQGKEGLETARISNYVSENGIPYFSEAQLAELKQFGAQHGVNIDYVVKVDKSDPLYSQMKAEGKKPTTKAQPSGYTALQINFKTKTGEIMEWQFRGDKVNEFAEGEHIPYDLRTNKNIIGEHKELEPLYNPIKELLSKETMSEETYKEYNRYLTDYYTHLRKLELGFESTEPKLEDYGKGFKFDARLKAENLVKLHEVAEKLKKGEITQELALNDYYETVSFNPATVEMQTSETSPIETSVKHQRTTEESLQIITSMCKGRINDYLKQQLLKYPESLNSLPLEAMKKVDFPVVYLHGIIQNWKPEFAKLPFDKIDTSQKMMAYINSLFNDPIGQAQTASSPFLQLQLGANGAKGTIRFFDFSPLKNTDGTFDMAKVTEYFKTIKDSPTVDAILEPIKKMFGSIGDIDAMVKDYPKFSKYLIEAFDSGMFNNQNILNFISNLTSKNSFNENTLKIFEQFFNEGYTLQNKCNFAEMNYKAILSNSFATKDCAFNNLDKSTQDKLLHQILITNSPISMQENTFFRLLAEYVDNPEIINNICDNKLSPKFLKTMSEMDQIFAHQSNVDPMVKTKIKFNLALMKELNPEGYNELIHSKGFKEIKKGSLNAKLLENLKFDDKIDDNYFYNLFEGIETSTEQKLRQTPELAGYDQAIIKQIIEIDPSRQSEILDLLANAKDKIYMKNILSYLSANSRNINQNIINNESKGNIFSPKEIQDCSKAMLNILRIASQTPDLIKTAASFGQGRLGIMQINHIAEKFEKCKLPEPQKTRLRLKLLDNRNILDANGVPAAIDFAEKFDIDKLLSVIEHFKQYEKVNFGYLLSGVSENNIDFLMEMTRKGKINPQELSQILKTVKDIPEFKDAKNREFILETICKAGEETGFNRDIFTHPNLIEMKLHNPAQYNKILSSGIIDLVKSKKLDPLALKMLNSNSDLSEDIYNDLNLIKSGKSIVPEFKAGTPIEEVFTKTQCGDAIEIGDKMFINDGNSLVEWNMTKEKFLELFPPVERFATVQGSLGDCYLVSSLSSCMNNPTARAQLYKSFSLNGNDVTVTIKGYGDFNGSHTFPNGEVPKTQRQLIGCKGLQMIERTYAKTALRPQTVDFLPSLEVTTNSLMQRIQGGYAPQALSELLGFQNLGFSSRIPVGGLPKDSSIGISVNKNQARIENLLNNYSNNKDYLLNFGTIPAQRAESNLLKEYNLVSNHAYSIIGYDPVTKKVKIANPHSYSAVTEVPIDILSKYVSHVDITRLR